MMSNHVIPAKEVKTCLLCGEHGFPLYQGLTDRLFDAPGTWSVFCCDQCKLLWLNPQPFPEHLHRCYTHYYTHTAAPAARLARLRKQIKGVAFDQHFNFSRRRGFSPFLVRMVAALHPISQRAAYSLMFFPCRPGEHLLDVGCGRGDFLAEMQQLGCKVIGVEADSIAAEFAQRRLAERVLVGTLEEVELRDAPFDAITMRHVIEHLQDPITTLRRCLNLLKPGGKLALITPNIQSLGHGLFRQAWRELDPPRHLFLFAPFSLRLAVEKVGFKVIRLDSSVGSATAIYAASQEIRRNGRSSVRVRKGLRGMTFMIREELVNLVRCYIGEEIGMLAEKPLEVVEPIADGGRPYVA